MVAHQAIGRADDAMRHEPFGEEIAKRRLPRWVT
jgi:hypothetical protein